MITFFVSSIVIVIKRFIFSILEIKPLKEDLLNLGKYGIESNSLKGGKVLPPSHTSPQEFWTAGTPSLSPSRSLAVSKEYVTPTGLRPEEPPLYQSRPKKPYGITTGTGGSSRGGAIS